MCERRLMSGEPYAMTRITSFHQDPYARNPLVANLVLAFGIRGGSARRRLLSTTSTYSSSVGRFTTFVGNGGHYGASGADDRCTRICVRSSVCRCGHFWKIKPIVLHLLWRLGWDMCGRGGSRRLFLARPKMGQCIFKRMICVNIMGPVRIGLRNVEIA